jgi:hypothetical protein
MGSKNAARIQSARNAMNHSELVEIGYKWLIKSVKCPFAFKELRTYSWEQPDVIGWKGDDSILVECKISRADFQKDRHKLFRRVPHKGVGDYRFYLTPKGLLKSEDIPEKWGWLEADESGKIIERVAPSGNIWSGWPRFEKHRESELRILRSALRRISSKTNIQEFL